MKIDPSKVKAFVQNNKKNALKTMTKKGKKGAGKPPEHDEDDDEDEDEDDGHDEKKQPSPKPPKKKKPEDALEGDDGGDEHAHTAHADADGNDDDDDEDPAGEGEDVDAHDAGDGDDGDEHSVSEEDVDQVADDIAGGKGDKQLMKWSKKVNEANNPPKVIMSEDEHVWDKAKEAAKKYEGEDNFYPVVMSVFEKMGGRFRHPRK